MVRTPEGIPLCHHVFHGNTADKTTVTDVVKDLKERFALRRVIFVGDRGRLSDLNLGGLIDEQLRFIVAHHLRRNLLDAAEDEIRLFGALLETLGVPPLPSSI
jgi:transposase